MYRGFRKGGQLAGRRTGSFTKGGSTAGELPAHRPSASVQGTPARSNLPCGNPLYTDQHTDPITFIWFSERLPYTALYGSLFFVIVQDFAALDRIALQERFSCNAQPIFTQNVQI